MARARSVAPPLPRAIAPPAPQGPGRGGAGRSRLRLRAPPRLRTAARERRPQRGPVRAGTGWTAAAGAGPRAAGFRGPSGSGRRPVAVFPPARSPLALRRRSGGPAGVWKDP
uniref:Uncharacterized protein n=1 Tax=Rangifer tarandus platyrhynchus TaxID=3082113 RepID=A0ACB0F218_RANTA|nr:unnamed protein product [Rangifer tarandus platyrhynchus]